MLRKAREKMSAEDNYVFISYRRDFGSKAADSLYNRLRNSRLTVFMDRAEMTRGPWGRQLRKSIQQSKVVAVILSQDAFSVRDGHMGRKDMFLKEIKQAIKQKKIIVPVYLPGFDLATIRNCRKKKIARELTENQAAGGTDLNSVIVKAVELIIDRYQTRGVEYLEETSAKAIEAGRKINALLYDENEQIERCFLDDNGNRFSIDDAADLFAEHPRLFLSGEGGAGKTTAMQALFDRLHEDSSVSSIYLRAYDITAPGANGPQYRIIDYLNGLANREVLEDDTRISVYSELEAMNSNQARPLCVLLIDGLNEVSPESQKTILEALEFMAGKFIRLNIIISARYTIPGFPTDYWHIRLQELSTNQIAKALVKAEAISKEMYRLLKLPLYLRLYQLALRSRGASDVIPGNSKYAILKYAFIENPRVFDIVRNNPQYIVCFRYVLPCLCYFLTNIDLQALPALRLREALEKCLKGFCAMDAALLCGAYGGASAEVEDIKALFQRNEAGCDKLMQVLIGSVFQEYTDERSGITYCRFCHQDIRDFYAAYYLRCTFNLFRLQESSANNASELLYFDRESFSTEAVDILMESGSTITDILPYNEKSDGLTPKVRAVILNIFSFLTGELIDRIHNNSPEKIEVCKRLRGALAEAASYIVENRSTFLAEEIDAENRRSILEILRRYGEVLRRLGEYADVIRISDTLITLAETQPEEYGTMISAAKNNIAKCKAYAAHRSAEEGNDNEEVYKQYVEALDMLKENAELYHSEESANLYALVISFPDKTSVPYIRRYAESIGCDKKLSAFQYYCQAAQLNRSRYALQQCVSLVLHADVQLESFNERADSPFDLMPRAVAVKECNQDIPKRGSIGYDYVIKANRWLLTQKNPYMPRCFMGRLLLSEERYAEAAGYFGDAYSISQTDGRAEIQKSPLACFAHLLIDERFCNRQAALSAIENTLESKALVHNIDGYDTIYVCKEMLSIWEQLSKAGRIDDELKKDTMQVLETIKKYAKEIQ